MFHLEKAGEQGSRGSRGDTEGSPLSRTKILYAHFRYGSRIFVLESSPAAFYG
jgi:hypothetical protein